MTHLYSYKMTNDSGFAPNPFGKTLTLATCKPLIRKTKDVGHWVAGWTSNEMMKRLGNGQRVNVGEEKLIYLMRIAEKLTFEEYSSDPRFQDKKPKKGSSIIEEREGDNIYFRDDSGDWEEILNDNHCNNMENDLDGEYVLIAGEFYYFGNNSLEVLGQNRPAVPDSQTPYGNETNGKAADDFIDFVKQSYSGKIGTPHGR